MPEVKGNRMQFLKHVLWLHQLKPNDSTRKRNCKYSLASSSKKIGQYEEANSHAALTSFCVEHKIKPWVKKKKIQMLNIYLLEKEMCIYIADGWNKELPLLQTAHSYIILLSGKPLTCVLPTCINVQFHNLLIKACWFCPQKPGQQ